MKVTFAREVELSGADSSGNKIKKKFQTGIAYNIERIKHSATTVDLYFKDSAFHNVSSSVISNEVVVKKPTMSKAEMKERVKPAPKKVVASLESNEVPPDEVKSDPPKKKASKKNSKREEKS